MCGINGIMSQDRMLLSSISKMNVALRHRGPDDEGILMHQNIALGQRRLSIVDLSENGHQPMTDLSGDIVIIYNGEVYNHMDIRSQLSNKKFNGHSDSETLIYAYIEYGIAFLELLNGIFALAILDKRKNKLIIARDRLGVKPLYLAQCKNTIAFSSEIKSLISTGVSDFTLLDYKSMSEYSYFGYTMDGRTMYKNVRKVKPGYYLEIDLNEANITQEKPYYILSEHISIDNKINESEAIVSTRLKLEKAVQRQLMSDVPVGVFLSGGVDSTAIAYFASKHYQGKIKTYTATFDFYDGLDEAGIAQKTSKILGTEHNEIHIKSGQLPDLLTTLIDHHDEPFSDAANIPLYLMTQAIQGQCKVVLQGDGGDELYGGYNSYSILEQKLKFKYFSGILHYLNWINPFAKIKDQGERFYDILHAKDMGTMVALLSTMETRKRNPQEIFLKSFSAQLVENPFDYYSELSNDAQFKNETDFLFYANMMTMLPEQFLEKVDKSTMANGIEVRVPFLDNDLVQFSMQLPSAIKVKNGQRKYILKEALKEVVPDFVLNAPKKGFGVPYGNWLKGPLHQFFYDTISDRDIQDLGIFNFEYIDRIMKEYKSGKHNHSFTLWKTLHLALWMKKYKIRP